MNSLLVMLYLCLATNVGQAQDQIPASKSHPQDQVRLHGIPHHLPSSTPYELQAPFDPQQQALFNRTTHHHKTATKMEPCEDVNLFMQAAGSPTQIANYLVGLPNVTCTYPLFSTNAAQASVIFTTANMNAVADRITQLAPSYNGSGRAIGNLVLYLRAGYFNVTENNTVADFGANTLDRVETAVNSFLNNSQAYADNPDTPSTLNESLILVTNAQIEARFLARMRTFISNYTQSANEIIANRSLSDGILGAMNIFFYAHFRSNADAILRDPAYPQTLYGFFNANVNALKNTNRSFHLTNALTEAFRFLQYGTETRPTVRPMVQTILANNDYRVLDEAPFWIAAANSVQAYDDCNFFNLCNARQDVETFVLKDRSQCGSSVNVIAQDVTTPQSNEICQLLQAEEILFHDGLNTGRNPVADDFNDILEVVIFDDYDNYNLYASYLYNAATNNGGIYLEGDPSDANNQARFLAHEASWLRPEFAVWNLEHEFIHYLDGRFNLKGDFGDSIREKTVWWIEGLAEYYSLQNNNQAAIDVGRNKTFPLSEIFQNTYQSQPFLERVYRWGYLAVRFMFERHRNEVDTILTHFRAGDYAAYTAYMQSIGTNYDNEFNSWLDTVSTEGPFAGGDGGTSGDGELESGVAQSVSGAQGDELRFYIDVPEGMDEMEFKISGGTGDADIYIRFGSEPTLSTYDHRPWLNGNNETVNVTNPNTGRWHIMIHGYNNFDQVSLVATYSQDTTNPPPSECPDNLGQLGNNCTRNNLSSTSVIWYAIWIPSGASNLVISTSGGSGDVDIFVRRGSWPNATTYDHSSTGSGTTQSVSIANPGTHNWYYIMLDADPTFTDISVSASFDP